LESSKLKNLVLLILIITNLLLGLLMLIQGMTSRQRQAQLLLDAVALLEERGIAVDPDIIPRADFPPSMTLERDSDWELEMFSGLLGESTTATQRGLVSYYTGELGRSEAREDGSFTAAFRTVKDSQQAAYGTGSLDQRTHGLDVLKRMGLEAMVVGEDEDTLEVVQLWNGKPVFSCTATLTYEFGCLAEISGARLTGIPTAEATQAEPLSIPTLLLRFRSGIIDSGDACSAILSATQGYVLSPGPSGASRLTPVLRLETDTNLYLVDALTGAISRG
jgi:hypothetical protein